MQYDWLFYLINFDIFQNFYLVMKVLLKDHVWMSKKKFFLMLKKNTLLQHVNIKFFLPTKAVLYIILSQILT